MAWGGTIRCPVCGQASGPEIVECPNCGNDLSQYRAAAGGLASIQGPAPVPVPPPTPAFEAPRPGRGVGPKVIAALLIVALLVPGALFLRDAVEGALDELTNPGSDNRFDRPPDPGTEGNSIEGFAGVHDIVRTLRLQGVRCKQVNVQTSTNIFDAGSCLHGTVPITIMVYFEPLAFDSVLDAVEDDQFTFVRKDNAIVLCPDHPTARRIRSALKGRLHVGSR